MPRSASRSSTSRKLRLNTWYSQTAWLMTSEGKHDGGAGQAEVLCRQSRWYQISQPDLVTVTIPLPTLFSASRASTHGSIGYQLPCKPFGTRCGSFTTATGDPEISSASRMTKLDSIVASSVAKVRT
jgi:hypothetical protein